MSGKSEYVARVASISRKTGESSVSVTLDLDSGPLANVKTPIGMLTHMLDQLARHGALALTLTADGDISTGVHHVSEDTAIVLGRCLDEALDERRGIVRMGHAIVPLDEALAQVALDVSGRGYPVIELGAGRGGGEFDLEMARHFLESFAIESRLGLHVRILAGQNEHHVMEATFKGLARALRMAIAKDDKAPLSVPSTKGTLT